MGSEDPNLGSHPCEANTLLTEWSPQAQASTPSSHQEMMVPFTAYTFFSSVSIESLRILLAQFYPLSHLFAPVAF